MKEKAIIVILVLAMVINTAVGVIISGLATPNGLMVISVTAACSAVVAHQLNRAMGSRRRSKRNG